jgi:hypothetical protein
MKLAICQRKYSIVIGGAFLGSFYYAKPASIIRRFIECGVTISDCFCSLSLVLTDSLCKCSLEEGFLKTVMNSAFLSVMIWEPSGPVSAH